MNHTPIVQRMLLYRGKFFPQIKTPPLPKLIHFSLTNVCNLSCPFCWRNRNISNKKRFESAPDKVIDKWLDLVNDGLDTIHPGGGGEPLLHPRFGEFIRKALDLQKSNPEEKPKILCVTNGTLIGKWPILLEALETGRIQVIVSMESAHPERYKLFRIGGNLKVIEKNMLDIQKARERGDNFHPHTVVKIDAVLTRHNVEDAAGLIDFASRTGADIIAFKKPYSTPNSPRGFRHEDSVLTSSQLHHMTMMKEKGKDRGIAVIFFGFPDIEADYTLEGTRLPCEDIFRSVRLHPNGNVYTCCPVVTDKARVGNSFEEGLYDIWNSKKLKKARSRIISGRPASICTGCFHKNLIAMQTPVLRKRYLAEPDD